ncbi:MAG: leucine-rich repeat protein [Treponema sp.]|nr:leucine-rich repeat protein [Treponema sp.]
MKKFGNFSRFSFITFLLLLFLVSCRNLSQNVPTPQNNTDAYIVKYNSNAPSGKSVKGTVEEQRHIFNDARMLRNNSYSLVMHDFTGWYTEAGSNGEGSGKCYAAGEEVENLTSTAGGTVHLYAGWKNRGGYNQNELSNLELAPSQSGEQTVKIVDTNWNKQNGATLEAVAKQLEVLQDDAITLDLSEINVSSVSDLFTKENIDRVAFGDDNALFNNENINWQEDKNHNPINVETIIIPKSLSKFESNYFANCIAVKKFVVPEENEWFFASNQDGQIVNSGKGEQGAGAILYRYAEKKVGDLSVPNTDKFSVVAAATSLNESVTIIDKTESIGHQAFYGAKIKTVSFPETLQTIYLYAFMNCKNLTSVEFPVSLENIYGYSFTGCALKNISFASGSKCFSIGTRAFQCEESFREGGVVITLPSSVQRLGGQVFGNNIDKLTINFGGTASSWYYFNTKNIGENKISNFSYTNENSKSELKILVNEGLTTKVSDMTSDYQTKKISRLDKDGNPTEVLVSNIPDYFWFKEIN